MPSVMTLSGAPVYARGASCRWTKPGVTGRKSCLCTDGRGRNRFQRASKCGGTASKTKTKSKKRRRR